MKTLLLTIAIGEEYQKIAELTHPTFKAYAEKIGAEFLNIDEKKISQTTPHWEKFQIFDLLNKYERILYVDTDVLIREDCPDLFKEVPEYKLGIFNEASFTDRSKELIIDICKSYDVKLQKWNGKYYNSGIMVISRCHKYLFKKPEKEIFNFYEQSYLNMMIAKDDIIIHELPYKFNRMTCLDRFLGKDRHDSYIIHYAGYPSLSFVLEIIKKDISVWEKDKGNYNYKTHIYVSVIGGLGDQVAAEPAVRFMRKELYPNEEMVIATHFPQIFSHLEDDGVVVCKQGEAKLKDDVPYFLTKTLPGPDESQWSIVSHLMCHTVDYSAMALMKKTLPIKDKRIKLKVNLDSIANLMSIIGYEKLDELIVVHPGRHWVSKSFPKEYWQGIIDGLVKEKKKVVIVGKDEAGDPPLYKAGARGTVDVVCPEGAYDLRNLLDLDSLIGLLSVAKVLISNDSAPIHIAGAFDNWIILIPSCKHPDHILPWRNGNQYYKAMALYKKLTLRTEDTLPTLVTPTTAEFKDGDWENYLPEINKVVKRVLEIE